MKQRSLGVVRKIKTRGLLTGLLTLTVLIFQAASLADAVVQGFTAQGDLQPGRIVALSGKSTVVAAPAKDTTQIYGVVVDPKTAPVVVSSQKDQVYVATAGSYPVLVSNENGAIKAGDFISLSSTDGIGAKATAVQSNILGQALSGFDGQHSVITRVGNIAIGEVSVQVSAGTNPLNSKNSAPAALQKIASTLTGGKNVSAVRIYAGLIVFLLAFMAAVSLVWSGVKNGMISIGRNPLSRNSILASLTQVLTLSLIIFGIGMLAVYLILRL